MAEGGEFGMDQPDLDHDIDHEQEVNTTRPFYPGSASTPYHGGEQHEMQTMQHEQSGLPETSFDEVPSLGSLFIKKTNQRFLKEQEISLKGGFQEWTSGN